jgi:hypothetical protein
MYQSPFLDANPSFVTLLSDAVPSSSVLLDDEYVSLLLYGKDGRVVWESSLRPVSTGFGDFSEVPLSKFSSRPQKAWLVYLRVRNGVQHRSGRRVQWVYPKGKPGQIPNPDYGASVRKARRDVGRRVNPVPGKRSAFPRSSTLRPSPEIRNKSRQNFTEGNNGGYFFSPSVAVEQAYTRSWSGVRTPGFGALKKNQRPVNPHSVNIVDVKDSGLIEMFDIPSTGVYFNQYSAFTRRFNPPVLPSHDDVARSKAVRKLIERLESGIEGNIAQDIFEIRQTVKLLTTTATRVAKSAVALKNGNIPKAVQTLWGSQQPYYGSKRRKPPSNAKSTADNWLQMQYGWKPLLMDLHGSMEALARLHLADASIRQVTARAKTDRWVVEDLGLVQNPQKKAGWTRVQTVSHCKFGIRFTVDDHLKAFLAQSGFTNPLNLGWELLPFSFVADWFLPIGPWLSTLSGYHGLTFLDGFQTLFTKQRVESLVRFTGEIGPPAPGQNLQTAGTYGREVVILDRIRLNTFPVASFPSFKNPLSLTHAANALALVQAVFRR